MNGLDRLTTIRNISVKKGKTWVHKDIFRLLNKEDLWVTAYNNVYIRNKLKKDKKTSLYSETSVVQELEEVRLSVMNESYYPSKIKNLNPPKFEKNFLKKRVIDVDTIVIEITHMILEAIFEPLFCDSNFGYSEKKNAHSALQYIEENFTDCEFIIQGEFQKAYRSINPSIFNKLLNKYIKDSRFNNLIMKFLKSGILDAETKPNSPIRNYEKRKLQELFLNIYLHELDEWLENYLKLSSHSRTDLNKVESISLPKVQYVRYMEQWILGIKKDNILVSYIKKELENFLVKTLKLTLPQIEVTCLTSGHISFLDYEIYLIRSKASKEVTTLKYTNTKKLRFDIPINKLLRHFEKNNIIKPTTSGYNPASKGKYTRLDDHKIVLYFTRIWNILQSYYSGITNPQKLQYLYWLLRMSCAMTLAHKHKSTCTQIFKKRGKSLSVEIPNNKRKIFFECQNLKTRKWKKSEIIINPFNLLQN